MPSPTAPTPVERAGAALVALEALGVAALVGWQIVALTAGDTVSLASAIALLVLTAVAAVAMGAFAFAILRGESWGRSGGIVAQLLLLAVALGAVTGTYGAPLIGLALGVPALVVLVVLVLTVKAAGARDGDDRDPA